jgi:hypothetical protein
VNPFLGLSQMRWKKSVDSLTELAIIPCAVYLYEHLSLLISVSLDKLSDILNNWDINDILLVIDEIDRRISIIEAINRLHTDKNTETKHIQALN